MDNREMLPTPLFLTMAAAEDASGSERGVAIWSAYQTFSRWSLAVATSLYLWYGEPVRKINIDLFGWMNDARLIRHHRTVDAICPQAKLERASIGRAFVDAWRRARALEGINRPVIDELQEHGRIIRHVDSASSRSAYFFSLRQRLFETFAEFSSAHPAFGSLRGEVVQFTGASPRRIGAAAPEDDCHPQAWLAADGDVVPLPFVQVETGASPQMVPLDEVALSQRMVESIR